MWFLLVSCLYCCRHFLYGLDCLICVVLWHCTPGKQVKHRQQTWPCMHAEVSAHEIAVLASLRTFSSAGRQYCCTVPHKRYGCRFALCIWGFKLKAPPCSSLLGWRECSEAASWMWTPVLLVTWVGLFGTLFSSTEWILSSRVAIGCSSSAPTASTKQGHHDYPLNTAWSLAFCNAKCCLNSSQSS